MSQSFLVMEPKAIPVLLFLVAHIKYTILNCWHDQLCGIYNKHMHTYTNVDFYFQIHVHFIYDSCTKLTFVIAHQMAA